MTDVATNPLNLSKNINDSDLMDEDSFLNKESSENSQKNKKDHWFWSNWILLSLGAAVCFTVGDLMLGSL
jgi:hypothetical protein